MLCALGLRHAALCLLQQLCDSPAGESPTAQLVALTAQVGEDADLAAVAAASRIFAEPCSLAGELTHLCMFSLH